MGWDQATAASAGESAAQSPFGWRRFFDEFIFFAWWVRLSARVEALTPRTRIGLLVAAAVLGTAARLWAQTKPGNYDFRLWWLISEAALNGEDPYSLHRYNYPPVWLGIVTVFQSLTSSEAMFRFAIAVLLCLVDIGIASILARKGYGLAAVLFLISPITVAISGQHQQVDGLAVLLALTAMVLAGRNATMGVARSDWFAALVLGLSLSAKPVFLVLPLWFLLRSGSWSKRLVYACVPYLVFAAALGVSMAMYSPGVVMRYVIGHQGANNSPLLWNLLPDQVVPGLIEHGGAKVAFLLLLIPAGLLFRRLRPLEFALVYSVSALLFSWAVANQYLAIPMAAVAVFLNLGFLIWLGMGALYLGGDPAVLDLPVLRSIQPHVLLEYDIVFRDMWPWLFMGWLLLAFALRKPFLHWDSARASKGAPDA